jgi:hypothetical protein
VWIEGVELAGLDQRNDDGPVFRADVVAHEEGVFSVQCDGTDCPLDGFAVKLDPATSQEQAEAVPVFGDIF